jgi:hypothetical protein
MHMRLAGQDAWGHSGDIYGFHADLWHLPSADVTVAALINRNLQDGRRRLVDALARVAVSLVRARGRRVARAGWGTAPQRRSAGAA